MTTITVNTVARPLDDDMFADITAAAVTFDETTPATMAITFADDDTPLTGQQVAWCRIRVLTPDQATETVWRSQWEALTQHQAFAGLDPATITLGQVVAELQLIAAQAAQLIAQTQEIPT